jgi:hypothetical protein
MQIGAFEGDRRLAASCPPEYTRLVKRTRPLQFSLGSLLCLLVGIGSVLASLVPHGAYAPLVGWCILAILYCRQGWTDLLFVHGVLPAISLSMMAILALFAIVQWTAGPWTAIREDFGNVVYWLLFVSCLSGNLISQIYYVYLLVVVGSQHQQE